MFIQHLATTTHNVVKTERKPRRNIQYRDVSSAIAKTDNLEFAVDVVPKTIVFKEAKKRREDRELREKELEEKREREREEKEKRRGIWDLPELGGEKNGDAATDGKVVESPVAAKPGPAPDAMDVDERVEDSDKEEDAAAMQLEMEMRGPPKQVEKSPEVARETRRSTGGFTSINGAK